MSEYKIEEIENDIEKMFKEVNAHLESIKTNDIKRKPKFIIGLVRELELKTKLIRLKLKTLEYKTQNQQMRDKLKV